MQPFRTLNFRGDYNRDGEKYKQRYHCGWLDVNTNRCECCRVWSTPLDAPLAVLNRECHTFTPRLHLEDGGDVTRLKTIYAFGEVGGGYWIVKFQQKDVF